MAPGYRYLGQGMNLLMCMLVYNAVGAMASTRSSGFCPDQHIWTFKSRVLAGPRPSAGLTGHSSFVASRSLLAAALNLVPEHCTQERGAPSELRWEGALRDCSGCCVRMACRD